MNTAMQQSADSSSSFASTLLRGLRQRDAEAWHRLVHVFSPLIYQWCRHQGLQPADAADLMQDVFRSVMHGIEAFRRDRADDSFRGWLWTITRNKLLDFHRAKKTRPWVGLDSAQLDFLPFDEPENQSEPSAVGNSSSPLYRALELVRSDFSEATWTAFWRVTMEEQKAVDVAAELGISVNAVRKAKARVLGRLQSEIGDLLGLR